MVSIRSPRPRSPRRVPIDGAGITLTSPRCASRNSPRRSWRRSRALGRRIVTVEVTGDPPPVSADPRGRADRHESAGERVQYSDEGTPIRIVIAPFDGAAAHSVQIRTGISPEEVPRLLTGTSRRSARAPSNAASASAAASRKASSRHIADNHRREHPFGGEHVPGLVARGVVGGRAPLRLRRDVLEEDARQVALAGVGQDGDDELALRLRLPGDLHRGGDGRAAEMPQVMPSSLWSRRAISIASSLETVTISSTSDRSSTSGLKPAPMPWILCGPGLGGSPLRIAVSTGECDRLDRHRPDRPSSSPA